MAGHSGLKIHSTLAERKAGVLSPDDKLSKGNQLSMYSSHVKIMNNKRATVKSLTRNLHYKAQDGSNI